MNQSKNQANQNGRRNLTDGWKWEMAQSKKSILMERGREKYKETVGRPGKESLSTIDNDLDIDNDLEKHNTRDKIAKDLGWSTGKV